MSYNVQRQFVGAGLGGGGGGRGGGGVVQNRESPDFRSSEVGRYAEVSCSLKRTPTSNRQRDRQPMHTGCPKKNLAALYPTNQLYSRS